MPKSKKQKFPYLQGSKWTAQKKVDGWRHFEVVNRKNQGKWVYAEMVSSCDPNVRFWMNAKILQDQELWRPGWQTLEDIRADELIPFDEEELIPPLIKGG
ncbi:hypothetical protein NIES4071_55580 [Calothrix sp. NIES-4071]|nr:hypothetical protein NIES4071_55580 [Calothrix sp. NIES-4071]BAZ59865.1 hypothetical protein NIES4105_55530 [Calothrix sp. NIES-4105]